MNTSDLLFQINKLIMIDLYNAFKIFKLAKLIFHHNFNNGSIGKSISLKTIHIFIDIKV